MSKEKPASHRLRLHRRRLPGGIFSVTKNVEPRRYVLYPYERQLISSAFEFCVCRGDIEVGAYVVMPDHFHTLVGLLGELTLESWMHGLMSYVGGRTCPALSKQGCSWQDGLRDTEVRTQKQFNSVIDYIHYNPVKTGLVRFPEDWDATSANWPDWVRLAWA